MLTGYDAIVRNYCNVSEFNMRFDWSAWANQKRELHKIFLGNRFWFETYTMTIPGFLWRTHFECVSGSVLITVNKPLCISTYLNINLQSWKPISGTLDYGHVTFTYIYTKKHFCGFFKKQILRYSILFREFKRLVKKS